MSDAPPGTPKRISVVIPFFNEVDNIVRIHDELRGVWAERMPRYELEVILMDNASTDGSFEVARDLASRFDDVHVLRLSRNFGYQANIQTGLLHASGDAVVALDADGEDDPALIPHMVALWEGGSRVVYGVRRRRSESRFLTLQRKIFYRLLNLLATIPIPHDAGDFRLLDRTVVDALRRFEENNPYLRGLVAYVGFRQTGFEYDRRPRGANSSKFNWLGYVGLALDGIVAFSIKPMMIMAVVGIILSMGSAFGVVFYFAFHFLHGTNLPGFTTLAILQLFSMGVQLFGLGLLGAYVGRIADDVKRRPRSIVETQILPGKRERVTGSEQATPDRGVPPRQP